MHNVIISQNLKLLDNKLIFNEDKEMFETIKDIKYRVLEVTREFEPVLCPKCGNLVHKTKEYVLRKIKTFFNYDYPVIIYYKQRRLKCDCGKTIQENNSLVQKGKNISNYLIMEILRECKYKISFTEIGKKLDVDTTTVINVFMEHANFERRSLTEVLCVDEFSANIDDNNPYALIIGDPVSKEILDILPSRHQEEIDRYLSKIPKEERLKVKLVNIDMWEAYKVSFSAYCPNAKIAVDAFHYISKATSEFHKLRRIVEEQTYNPKVKSILRNHWKLFGLNENKLSEKTFYSQLLNKYTNQREMVEYCINSDHRLEDAWIILQKIYKFRDNCTVENCREKLKEIIDDLENTNLEQMMAIAKTYKHWFNEICNSFITYGKYNKKASNAFIEGKNRLCKEIKAIGCGYNNFWIYRARILYISANTPIPFSSINNKRHLYKKKKRKRVK